MPRKGLVNRPLENPRYYYISAWKIYQKDGGVS